MTRNDLFIGKVARRFVAPTVAGLFALSAASLIQNAVVGLTIGAVGLAAMALCAALPLIGMSLGAAVGVGASVSAAAALGAGDAQKADSVYSAAFFASLVLGGSLLALGEIFAEWVARALGAGGENLLYVTAYLRFYLPGMAFYAVFYVPMSFLRLIGKPKTAMNMLLILGAVQLCAVILMVYGLNLGIEGAAAAASLGVGVAYVYGLVSLMKSAEAPKLRKPKTADLPKALMNIVTLGSPAALNNFCMSLQVICVNRILVYFGAGDDLPVFTVVNAILGLCMAFTIGIPQGVLPLFGIAYGERDFAMVKSVAKNAFLFGNAVVLAVSVLLAGFSGVVPKLFGVSGGLAGHAVIVFALSLNLAFVNNLAVYFFNAAQRAGLANFIVFCRLALFMIIPAFLLVRVFGAYMLWPCYVFAELLTLAAAAVFMHVTKTPLMDEKLAQGIISADFSVAMSDEEIVAASRSVKAFCKEAGVASNRAMAISLATEEILVLIRQYSFPKAQAAAYAAVRVTKVGDSLFLRTRNEGKRFNAVEWYNLNKDSEPDGTMGIAMITKLTKSVEYNNVFGVNNMIVEV